MHASILEKLYFELWALESQKRQAIQLRFWEQNTIEDIAKILKISWDEADKLIEATICELRQKLLNRYESAHSAA